MHESFDLDPADRITVGTIGEIGRRVFLLQASQGTLRCTLKVEKGQVAALAQYLGKMLAELPRPGHLPGDLELEEPNEPDWVAGALGVSYDDDTDRFVLVAEEVGTGEEDATAASARFGVTREQIAALAIRAAQLVEAGRPPCPLCGYPLDPSGHACPKTNGYRPPTL